jgi:hypothetical protein
MPWPGCSDGGHSGVDKRRADGELHKLPRTAQGFICLHHLSFFAIGRE